MNNSIQLHNEFTILKTTDGTTTQVGKAFNVVTDGGISAIARNTAIVNTLSIGTGSGVPSSGDKSLFKHLNSFGTTKGAVVRDTKNKCITYSYYITLGTTSCNGSTITEVGFGSNSNIYTHAMIVDANGNNIGITKTDKDIITIYGYIYAYYEYDETTLQSRNFEAMFRSLSGSGSFGISLENVMPIFPINTVNTDSGSSMISSNVSTVDSTVTLKCTMSELNRSQGPIIGLSGFVTDVNFKMPNAFDGYEYLDMPCGIGDGVTTDFMLEAYDVKDGTLSVKLDGTIADVTIAPSKSKYLFLAGSSSSTWYSPITIDNNQYILTINNQRELRVYDIVNYKAEDVTEATGIIKSFTLPSDITETMSYYGIGVRPYDGSKYVLGMTGSGRGYVCLLDIFTGEITNVTRQYSYSGRGGSSGPVYVSPTNDYVVLPYHFDGIMRSNICKITGNNDDGTFTFTAYGTGSSYYYMVYDTDEVYYCGYGALDLRKYSPIELSKLLYTFPTDSGYGYFSIIDEHTVGDAGTMYICNDDYSAYTTKSFKNYNSWIGVNGLGGKLNYAHGNVDTGVQSPGITTASRVGASFTFKGIEFLSTSSAIYAKLPASHTISFSTPPPADSKITATFLSDVINKSNNVRVNVQQSYTIS